MTAFAFDEKDIYTVSRLNNEARLLLEQNFPYVWVEGEISNFAAPHSGHWYFSLKDANAQVRCALFRTHQRKIEFTPKDGMHVMIKARVSLYENRGEFQVIAEHMEERGEGKLRRAFEVLKKKLDAAGLFDAVNKKPLPLFPKQIGIITSATGAAIRDIITVLKRRHPSLPIIIYPTLVQGESAAPAIVRAIETANRRNECDVLILARGGGSLEDLWPFNEEIVALAIHQSQIPMISGVGHEVDFTIADFVADQRAPTPSAAAEMAALDCKELLQRLARLQQQLQRQMKNVLTALSQQLTWMQKNLQQGHPKRRLSEKMQQLDYWEAALTQLQSQLLTTWQSKLHQLDKILHQHSPTQAIQQWQHQLQIKQQHIHHLMTSYLNLQQTKLINAAGTLDALSPLATLKRGFAIAMHEGRVLANANEVTAGDEVEIRLAQGGLACKVETVSH